MKADLSLLTDFYEFTMANAYLDQGIGEKVAYFDMYFRKIPDGGGYAIMAGVEQVVDFLSELSFSASDIEFLRGKGIFSENFLEYLRDFKFACDV